jgi:hypothetical protein
MRLPPDLSDSNERRREVEAIEDYTSEPNTTFEVGSYYAQLSVED